MQPIPFSKKALPLVAQLSGVSPLKLALERHWHTRSLRAIIYHSVPQARADNFERQVRYYARHYLSVGPEELRLLLEHGEWNHAKPGLIVSFDDGTRSHAEVAAPILEKYGLRGWFFVPTGFLDTPPERQRAFAHEHQIAHNEDLPGERIALTWDQARELAEKHVVGGHTASHVRLSDKLIPQQLEHEIPRAKKYLEQQLGKSVDSFAWVGGEEWSYSQAAAEAIRDAGFRYSFMTNSARIDKHNDPLQIDRARVEPHWPMPMVHWQLAGLMDAAYRAKRQRVHKLTAVAARDSASSSPPRTQSGLQPP